MKQIGQIRCPQGAVVTQTGKNVFSINSDKRCPGVGPVFEGPKGSDILVLHCPQGKKDEGRWKNNRAACLKKKPLHESETIEMRKDIWSSEVES